MEKTTLYIVESQIGV